MTSPKVSIIIPVYNATKAQLKASIYSAINQTYSNLELIIINDKSNKEETINLLSRYSNIDTFTSEEGFTRPIKIYNNHQNIGISSSRNKGMDESTGDYICFLDQDDYYDQDYVVKMVEAIEAEDADVAMCGFYSLDESENIIGKFPKDDMDITSPWYPWSICAIWNRIYRREFIKQHNIRFPDGCVTEDIVFLMQCNTFSKRNVVVNEPLYRNVIRQSSTSHSKEFHALKLDQMPFDQVSRVINSTIDDNSLSNNCKYLHALICDEMALLCFVLSVGSERNTVKEAANKAGAIIRMSSKNGKLKNLNQFNKYCKDKKSMQILILLMYCSSKLHIESQIVMIVRSIIRIIGA